MSDNPPPAENVFDIDNLRRLAEMMEKHGLSEVDLQQGEYSICLKRGSTHVAAPAPAPPAPVVSESSAAAAPVSEEHIVYIRSPMVGTFYWQPNPNAERYVKVGDHVSPETTVCLVEAMKTFNEIPAEVSGQIVAVLVENEEPVEFDKPLFKVDTSK